MRKELYLIMEDGSVFPGKSVGAYREATGEVVFTTGMTGYIETLTDPSYYGQIVTQTFPQIGDYGMINSDRESEKCCVTAYVVHDICDHPSNFRCEGTLEDFLIKNDIICICGVDTRSLTKLVREHGVMNGRISFSDKLSDDEMKALKEFKIKNAVASVGSNIPDRCTPENAKYTVVLWDFGAKANIERKLAEQGCDVHVMPFDSTAADILALSPDGIMLSNGPGDPAENTAAIAEIKKLLDCGVPVFGICLGHQMLALAAGAKTIKLKYGHRGANQPVRELSSGRLFITSQNHGYAVDSDSIPDKEYMRVSFENANDRTCEGIDYLKASAFSVQFHPEAASGTHDTYFLFNRFIEMMEGKKNAVK